MGGVSWFACWLEIGIQPTAFLSNSIFLKLQASNCFKPDRGICPKKLQITCLWFIKKHPWNISCILLFIDDVPCISRFWRFEHSANPGLSGSAFSLRKTMHLSQCWQYLKHHAKTTIAPHLLAATGCKVSLTAPTQDQSKLSSVPTPWQINPSELRSVSSTVIELVSC